MHLLGTMDPDEFTGINGDRNGFTMLGIQEVLQYAARKDVPPAIEIICEIMLLVADIFFFPGNVNGEINP